VKEQIDGIDSKIISYLQQNGRMAFTHIGKELNIAESTVRARVQRLIREEIIQIVAVANPLKLGFAVAGNMKIQAESKKLKQILEQLKEIQAFWYIALATGSQDIDIDFHVRSLDDLKSLIFDKVNNIDGVIRTETSIVVHYEKRQYDWGTALEEHNDKSE
jgi:Lrp/AsnC family transcriptional regulator for asnA, asnC and gidA